MPLMSSMITVLIPVTYFKIVKLCLLGVKISYFGIIISHPDFHIFLIVRKILKFGLLN